METGPGWLLVDQLLRNAPGKPTLFITLAEPQALLRIPFGAFAWVCHPLGHALACVVSTGAAATLHQLPALTVLVAAADLALVQVATRHTWGRSHAGTGSAC